MDPRSSLLPVGLTASAAFADDFLPPFPSPASDRDGDAEWTATADRKKTSSSLSSTTGKKSSRTDAKCMFPWRMHQLLEYAGSNDLSHVVSWLPGGRSFKVHDRDAFMDAVMPQYFKQSRYKSFVRQLNLWGFTCAISGPNKGSYSHDSFVQDDPELCTSMERVKIKGPASRRGVKKATTTAAAALMSGQRTSLRRSATRPTWSGDAVTGCESRSESRSGAYDNARSDDHDFFTGSSSSIHHDNSSNSNSNSDMNGSPRPSSLSLSPPTPVTPERTAAQGDVHLPMDSTESWSQWEQSVFDFERSMWAPQSQKAPATSSAKNAGLHADGSADVDQWMESFLTKENDSIDCHANDNSWLSRIHPVGDQHHAASHAVFESSFPIPAIASSTSATSTPGLDWLRSFPGL